MVRENNFGWKLELSDYERIREAIDDLDVEFVGSHGTIVEEHPRVEIDIGYRRKTDALFEIDEQVVRALHDDGMLIEETHIVSGDHSLLLVVTFEPGMYSDLNEDDE